MNDFINRINTCMEDDEKEVYLVANAANYTSKMKYYTISHACDDEFFSCAEYEEIVSCLYKTGHFVNIFYSELLFIDFIIKNASSINKEKIIVYNLARDGAKEGKKSLIPSFCDLIGLTYTGSNAFVISLCRNKYVWTSLLKTHHIKVPESFILNREEIQSNDYFENKKVIIKNIFESASIGLDASSIFTYERSRINELLKTRSNDVFIQEFIEGIECEVPFFKSEGKTYVMDPVRININNSDIISSKISNSYDYSFSLLKDELGETFCEEIKATVEKVSNLLNISDYGRVDFRITKDLKFYIIDIAATPYTIEHSSFAYVIKQYGLKTEDIYKIILYIASKRN